MTIADNICIDTNDLDTLYLDLDELRFVCATADETYDDENEKYNNLLEQLKTYFNQLEIEWLQEIISEDGTLYRFVAFDFEKEEIDILQKEYLFEAYEENLDSCIEKARDSVTERYSLLYSKFEEDSEVFLKELKNILSALKFAIQFTGEWKAYKINSEIDNT